MVNARDLIGHDMVPAAPLAPVAWARSATLVGYAEAVAAMDTRAAAIADGEAPC